MSSFPLGLPNPSVCMIEAHTFFSLLFTALLTSSISHQQLWPLNQIITLESQRMFPVQFHPTDYFRAHRRHFMKRVVLGSLKARSFFMVSVAALLAIVLALLFGNIFDHNSVSGLLIQKEREREAAIRVMISAKRNRTVNISRKLLKSSDDKGLNQIDIACSKNDIEIYQGQVPPLPNGIPTYAVQIMNVCPSDCSISRIHVHCGWFSSARLVNPRVFRRLHFDDCLINDGKALGPGRSIFFKYSNTYSYRLSVSSVVC